MPKAMAAVTLNPAQAVGLSDRGSLAIGGRADLLRVQLGPDLHPVVRETWVLGNRVY